MMTIFWTLQTEEVWIEYKKQGFLEGTESYAMYPDEYQWMKSQMSQRLPNYKGEQLIWLWIKKPDMRSTGHFESYTKCVRLKLDVPDDDVLISDFLDWHSVLNNTFNADNKKEFDDYYANKWCITKELSWNRIFDIHKFRDPEWDGENPRVLQGTTGRIDISKVKSVEHFISRKEAM